MREERKVVLQLSFQKCRDHRQVGVRFPEMMSIAPLVL